MNKQSLEKIDEYRQLQITEMEPDAAMEKLDEIIKVDFF